LPHALFGDVYADQQIFCNRAGASDSLRSALKK